MLFHSAADGRKNQTVMATIVTNSVHDSDRDNDTLVEDGSDMCWTSGPTDTSDGVMTPRRSIGNLDSR